MLIRLKFLPDQNLLFSNPIFDFIHTISKHTMIDIQFSSNKLFFSISAHQSSLLLLETSLFQKSVISCLISYQSQAENYSFNFTSRKLQLQLQALSNSFTIHSLLATNYVHIMLGATALFLPAPCRPACTLRARLNSKAAHSLQKQDTLGQEVYNYVGRFRPSSRLASSGLLEHWQRPPAAHSSTTTLSGRRIRT
jgi:hypothetical protein